MSRRRVTRGIAGAVRGGMENELSRPALKPSRRRALVSSAGILTVGALIGAAAQRPQLVVPPATPIVVEAPKLPAPVVTVNVPPPPAPAPPPAPEASPPPPPRALAPHLQAACVLPQADGIPAPASCAWDDGFPAVSDDGTQFVKKILIPEPLTPGGLTIGFFDTSTSRLVRQVVIISADSDYGAEGKLREGSEVRVAQRIAGLQRTLDAKGFHSLVALGSSAVNPEDPGAAEAAKARIHAEFDDAAARIVDPARSVVLWQHEFVSQVPEPRRNPDTDMCGGKSLHRLSMWWAPSNGVVLTELAFFTGGCMCPTVYEDQLHRIPAAALAAPAAALVTKQASEPSSVPTVETTAGAAR